MFWLAIIRFFKLRLSNNELIFKVVYIYIVRGKQKPRFNRTEYLTMNEALKHNTVESWNDSIYTAKLTGYKIK
jgi:hypothetical protein